MELFVVARVDAEDMEQLNTADFHQTNMFKIISVEMKDFNLNVKNLISLFAEDVTISDGLVKTKDITITSNRKEDLVMTGVVMVVGIAARRRAGNRMYVGIMRAGKMTVGIMKPGTMMVGMTRAGKMTGRKTTVE